MKDIVRKYITLQNGETLSYQFYQGGEKTLVLIHGNLASSAFYDELMEELPKEYTLYALDLRGFGQSTYLRPIDTLRDFAGDLKLFVDELGLQGFDLLGWSTGGAVSLFFTANYGDLVHQLFLVCSAGVSGYHSYRVDAEGTKRKLVSRKDFLEDPGKRELKNALDEKNQGYYEKVWAAAIYNQKMPPEDIFYKHMRESLLQKNLMDVYYGLAQFNISNYYNGISMGTEEVDRIQVPTTVIQGDNDLLVSVDEAKELKEAIGENAHLVILKNCGHSPMVDGLDALVSIITKS